MMRATHLFPLSCRAFLFSLCLAFLSMTYAGITCIKPKDSNELARLAKSSVHQEKQVAGTVREIRSLGHEQETAVALEAVAVRSHPADSERVLTSELNLGSVKRPCSKASKSSERSAFTAWSPTRPATKRKILGNKQRPGTPDRTQSREEEEISGENPKLTSKTQASIKVLSMPSDIDLSAMIARPIREKTTSAPPGQVIPTERCTSAPGSRPEEAGPVSEYLSPDERDVSGDGSSAPSAQVLLSRFKPTFHGLNDNATPSSSPHEINSSHPEKLKPLYTRAPSTLIVPNLPKHQASLSDLPGHIISSQSTEKPEGQEYYDRDMGAIPIPSWPWNKDHNKTAFISSRVILPPTLTSEEFWRSSDELQRFEKFNFETLFNYFESFTKELSNEQKIDLFELKRIGKVYAVVRDHLLSNAKNSFNNSPQERLNLAWLIQSIRFLEYQLGHHLKLDSQMALESMLSSESHLKLESDSKSSHSNNQIEGNSAEELITQANPAGTEKINSKEIPYSQATVKENTLPKIQAQQVYNPYASFPPGFEAKEHEHTFQSKNELCQESLVQGSTNSESETEPSPLTKEEKEDLYKEVLDQIGMEIDEAVNVETRHQIARLATSEGYKSEIINWLKHFTPRNQGFILLRPEIMERMRNLHHILTHNPHVNSEGEYESLPLDGFFENFIKHSRMTVLETTRRIHQALVDEVHIHASPDQKISGRGISIFNNNASPIATIPNFHHENSSKLQSNPISRYQYQRNNKSNQNDIFLNTGQDGRPLHDIDGRPSEKPNKQDFGEVLGFIWGLFPELDKQIPNLKDNSNAEHLEPQQVGSNQSLENMRLIPEYHHLSCDGGSTRIQDSSGPTLTLAPLESHQSYIWHDITTKDNFEAPKHLAIPICEDFQGIRPIKHIPGQVDDSQVVNPMIHPLSSGFLDGSNSCKNQQPQSESQMSQTMSSAPFHSKHIPTPGITQEKQVSNVRDFDLNF